MINTAVFHQSYYLNDEGLLPEYISTCLFCGHQKLDNTWVLQESPDIFLMQCPNCCAVSASRMPNNEALSDYYRVYYESGNPEKVTTDGPIRLATRIYDQFRGNLREPISILDFGGGDGSISYLVAKKLIKKGAIRVLITAFMLMGTFLCNQMMIEFV
jgi:hypothetical protein